MNGITRTRFVLGGVGLMLAACLPAPAASMAQSSVDRDAAPGVAQKALLGLAGSNNSFAFDLYGNLRDRNENLVFSPYSVSSALAMTYAGAHGGTESQMATALHFDLPQSQLHSAFNQLELTLARTAAEADTLGGQPLQLRIANSIWSDRRLVLLDDYLDLIARNYGAGIHLADFLEAFEEARNDINAWVSDQTERRIKDLVPKGAVDATTRMVLVNAIYFKGDWQRQFDANDTVTQPFHRLDGLEVSTRMMHAYMPSAGYTARPGYQAVQLPYEGATAAMTIIAPDSGNFNAFEAKLDGARFAEIQADLQPISVELGLPKFSFSSALDLGERLTGLGMPDAFDRHLADFSGMTGQRDLYISEVIHQAMVAVDEKGTEAAAATAVIIAPTSIMLPDEQLVVDRPFIFVITDLATGQILFLGRVLDPNE